MGVESRTTSRLEIPCKVTATMKREFSKAVTATCLAVAGLVSVAGIVFEFSHLITSGAFKSFDPLQYEKEMKPSGGKWKDMTALNTFTNIALHQQPLYDSYTEVNIDVTTWRDMCRAGTCIFRARLKGPEIHETYMQLVPGQTNKYRSTFQVENTGDYSLFVLWEAKSNSSEKIGDVFTNAIDIHEPAICVGETVSNNSLTVHIAGRAKPISALEYLDTMPVCKYDSRGVQAAPDFVWTSREVLRQRGFSPLHTLMAPDHMIGAKGVVLAQEYVWHSRNCRQSYLSDDLLSPTAFDFLALGTSRVFYMADGWNVLHAQRPPIYFTALETGNNDAPEMAARIRAILDGQPKRSESQRPLVVLLSHGVWQCREHNNDTRTADTPFTFNAQAEQSLAAVREGTDRPLHVIVATQPYTQPISLNQPSFDEDRRVYFAVDGMGRQEPLLGVRIETVNWAWKAAALTTPQNVSILDFGAMTMPRSDRCVDNVHYGSPGGTKLNWTDEVNFAMRQLVFAAAYIKNIGNNYE
ncbi:hypothetical protein BDR26DRAFT_863439 [Obelidium mucronatum]|nr:hypothetical protein BDR26DRAFT_863439 [Obelidium mucronatum]